MLLPSQLMPSFLEEEILKAASSRARFNEDKAVASDRDAVLEGLCSALCGLLRLVHLTGTAWVVQLKAPAVIVVYKPGRVTELDQFPKRIDVLLFRCPISLLRS